MSLSGVSKVQWRTNRSGSGSPRLSTSALNSTEKPTQRKKRTSFGRSKKSVPNRPLELPIEGIEEWEQKLKATNLGYARADAAASKKTGAFLKAYFSLRAKARLATQADVARKSGLSRSYVAVIESGEHIPQQKTLQKLARAFGVDVTALIP